MELLDNLKKATSGYKTYIMLAFGVVTVLLQYLGGFDLGVPSIPPATSTGELLEQLYAFLITGTLRAALTK